MARPAKSGATAPECPSQSAHVALVEALGDAEESLGRLQAARRTLAGLRHDRPPPRPLPRHEIWQPEEARGLLDTACANAFWKALTLGDVAGARLIDRERIVRILDPVERSLDPDEEHWQATALFGRLLPDLWALGLPAGENLSELIDDVIAEGSAAVHRCHAVIAALRRFCAKTWMTDEIGLVAFGEPRARNAIHAPLRDFGPVPAMVRATLRRADRDYPGDPPPAIRLRLHCGNNGFEEMITRLAMRPGFEGVFATRDRRRTPIGRWEPSEKVFASARSGWRIDGRPVQLEIATYVTDYSGSDEESRTRVAMFLEPFSCDVPLADGFHDNFLRGASTARDTDEVVIAGQMPVTTAARLFGPERCAHPRGEWNEGPHGDTLRLSCGDCLRPAVAVIPRHRLSGSDESLSHPDPREERGYLARLRIQALLFDRGVATDLDFRSLRRRDGLMSSDPADYAVTPQPRALPAERTEGIDATLSRRRRRRPPVTVLH